MLGVLGVFKYYNFFVVSLSTLLTKAHIPFNLDTIKIILPIGISFYTLSVPDSNIMNLPPYLPAYYFFTGTHLNKWGREYYTDLIADYLKTDGVMCNN